MADILRWLISQRLRRWKLASAIVLLFLIVLSGGLHGQSQGTGAAEAADAVNVQTLGAVGDDPVKDTAAFQKAAASGNDVRIPAAARCYRLTKTTTISRASKWVGERGACLTPDLGLSANSSLFTVNSNDVTFEDIAVVGTGLTYLPATVTHVAFHVGKNGGSYSNIRFRRIEVIDFKFADTDKPLSNSVASHAFYIEGANNVSVEDSFVTRISGAAVIAQHTSKISVLRNTITDAGWYPINMQRAVDGFDIGGNLITSTGASNGAFWGGGIDIMSQTALCPAPAKIPDRVRNGRIYDNRLSGRYGYGEVIRIASATNVVVERNVIADYDVAPVATDTKGISAIVIQTRGVFGSTLSEPLSASYIGSASIKSAIPASTTGKPYAAKVGDEWMCVTPTSPTTVNITARAVGGTTAAAHAAGATISNDNGPSANIVVRGNRISAPVSSRERTHGVYVRNELQSERNPLVGVTIIGNQFLASSKGTAFTAPILFHGFNGGIANVKVNDNKIVSGRKLNGSLGAVSTVASGPAGRIVDFSATGNTIVDVGPRGRPSAGFAFEHADRVNLGKNTLQAFSLPVRIFPTSSANVQMDRQTIVEPASR